MNYFTRIPAENFDARAASEFLKLYERFSNLPSGSIRNIAHLETPKHEFMEFIDTLERVFFLDNPTEKIIYSNLCHHKRSPIFNPYLDKTMPTAFILNINSRNEYEEPTKTDEEIKHLEVLEKELKTDSKQFLKIFTIGKKLWVYMNRQPTWEQLLKLKLIQWKIAEDVITTPEPNVAAFLQAFINKDLEEMNKAIGNILTNPKIIEYTLIKVKEVFISGASKSIKEVEKNIEDLQKDIMNTENYVRELIVKLKEKNTVLDALRNQPEEDLQPLMRYLSKHPYIQEVRKRADKIVRFYYEAPIIYFDKYVLSKIHNRKSGTEKEILNIFIKEEYELITRCCIDFNVDKFSVSFNVLGTSSNSSIIGHPHIDRFQCFGNHKDPLKASAEERNYYGAIEQISQAVLNLNFSDSYVIDTMLALLKDLPNIPTWRHKETKVMCSTKEVLEQYAKD